MKKSPLVLTIIGAICAIASVVLFCLLPQIGGDLNNYILVSDNFVSDLFGNLIPVLKGTISFGIEQPIFSGIIVGLLAVLVIFWVWHFIMLCATRRADSLFTNLGWLVFGLAGTFIALCYIGYSNTNGSVEAYVFKGTIGENNFNDGIGLIGALFNQGFLENITPTILITGILALAGIGYVLCLIAIIVSIHDNRTNPNEKVTEDDEVPFDENRTSEEEVQTNNNGEKTQSNVIAQPNGGAPLIVQNISYGGMGPMQYQPMPPMPPMPPREEPKEKTLTEEDVRRILAETLEAQQKAILESLNKKEEEKPVEPVALPEEKKETPVEERPLTAKELRAIIKNELRDHDHPEELLPLTDEQCRTLIRNELDEYYASTRPAEEVKEVEKKKEEEPVEGNPVEEDFMTADELSKMIRNEVVQVISENPKEEQLTIDEVKKAIKEELGSIQTQPSGVSKEETEELIKKEISSLDEDKKKQDELIASIKNQAFKAEYEAKLQAAKNEAALEKMKNSQITADDIRAILSEELDKRLANLEVKKEEPVAEEKPAPAPIVTKEEIVVAVPIEEAPVAPAEETNDEAKAERVPFANRLLGLDDDMKEIYNELKREALSYGLKSRLSISGDTFRLHTKTYLKIVVAGKGLKLYMALDPHDYKDTTIPVKDAGVKNLYKDIPLVFKVKSPLSVKRAKALIKDACEKDDLKKDENFEALNYISQLNSYKVAGTATEEDED